MTNLGGIYTVQLKCVKLRLRQQIIISFRLLRMGIKDKKLTDKGREAEEDSEESF